MNIKKDHSHSNVKVLPVSRLKVALGLTFTFMLVEFIGGYITGSLALISDAMHMMTDTFALLLALIAIHAGKKAADNFKTFGYVRFEILAAMLNALILLGVAFYILYEAYLRIVSAGPDIQSGGMLVIAAIGLVVNLISIRLLSGDKDNSLNVKGAYLEVWADMLGSVGVIAGAVIIWLTRWIWVDSVIAVLIGFMVFPRTCVLLKECINILLQGTPDTVILNDVVQEIHQTKYVTGTHSVHLWALTQNQFVFSAHVIYQSGADQESVRKEIKERLHSKFDIDNITLQMELKKSI